MPVILILIVFAPSIIGFLWPTLVAVGIWIALFIFKEIVGAILEHWLGLVPGFIAAFIFLSLIGL